MPYQIERFAHLLLFMAINLGYYWLGQPIMRNFTWGLAGLYGAAILFLLVRAIAQRERPHYGRLYLYLMLASAYLMVDNLWHNQADANTAFEMLEDW